MNIKNKNGVTLAALIITLIVMSILFSITYSASLGLLKNSQRKKMKTMLYMVQSRAEILLDEYLFEHDGEQLSTISQEEIEKELAGTYVTYIGEVQNAGYDIEIIPDRGQVIYCAWNEATLNSQGIDTKNLARGDTIIVQYNLENEMVEVASMKGFSNNGVGIHKLSEF